MYSDTDGTQAWQRPLSNGDIAVVIYNADKENSKNSINIQFTFQQLRDAGLKCDDSMKARELWSQKDLGLFTSSYAADVDRHDVQFLRLSKA